MTVTEFSVAKLIEVANQAISNLQADLDDHSRRVALYKARHLAAWQRDSLPQLRKVRDNLTAALKKGGPIKLHSSLKTDNLLYSEPSSTGYHIEQAVGKPRNGSRASVQENIDNLKAIVATLEAQTGKVISATQLRLVGVTKLGEMFRTAAITKAPK